MEIEHAALYVSDLEGAKDFFVRYFEAVPGALYHNPATGFRSYFLSFAGGARLEIMHRPDVPVRQGPAEQTGFVHLAFRTGSREAVDRLTARLTRDGYPVRSGPRVTGDGYYESCVAGFEGMLLEITA